MATFGIYRQLSRTQLPAVNYSIFVIAFLLTAVYLIKLPFLVFVRNHSFESLLRNVPHEGELLQNYNEGVDL